MPTTSSILDKNPNRALKIKKPIKLKPQMKMNFNQPDYVRIIQLQKICSPRPPPLPLNIFFNPLLLPNLTGVNISHGRGLENT